MGNLDSNDILNSAIPSTPVMPSSGMGVPGMQQLTPSLTMPTSAVNLSYSTKLLLCSILLLYVGLQMLRSTGFIRILGLTLICGCLIYCFNFIMAL